MIFTYWETPLCFTFVFSIDCYPLLFWIVGGCALPMWVSKLKYTNSNAVRSTGGSRGGPGANNNKVVGCVVVLPFFSLF